MTTKFGTTELAAQSIVGIRTTTRMVNISAVMGELFGELTDFLGESGQVPIGMPLAIYHSMESGEVDLECAMPVATHMEGRGRVTAGELPAGKAAVTTHMGPYQELSQTWDALTAWMGEQDLQPRSSPWEVYVNDPGAEPDQSKWRTDIFFPVK